MKSFLTHFVLNCYLKIFKFHLTVIVDKNVVNDRIKGKQEIKKLI